MYFRGKSIHPFCSKVKRDPLQTECTDDRNSVALCNLIRHDYPLPKMYQNFDYINNVQDGEEEFYGGSVTLADFCPFIQEFTWRSKNVIVRGSQCQFEDNNPSESTLFLFHLNDQTILLEYFFWIVLISFNRAREKLRTRILWESFKVFWPYR